MRMTQAYGLTKEAMKFLDENCETKPIRWCPHCRKEIDRTIVKELYAQSQDGLCNDGPDLFEYTLKDGSKIKSVVQFVTWSSGPMIFECLENEKGEKSFEWTKESANKASGEDVFPIDEAEEDGGRCVSNK